MLLDVPQRTNRYNKLSQRRQVPASQILLLSPVLSAVIDSQYLDAILLHPIDDHVRQGWEQKLSRPFLAPDAAIPSVTGQRHTLYGWSAASNADGGLLGNC